MMRGEEGQHKLYNIIATIWAPTVLTGSLCLVKISNANQKGQINL